MESQSSEVDMEAIKKAVSGSDKSKNKNKTDAALDSDTPWRGVFFYVSTLEVEIGSRKPTNSFKKGQLEERLIELLVDHMAPESREMGSVLLNFMLNSHRVGKCVDCRSSPFFGPSTKRVSYLVEKNNVFFDSPVLIPGRYKINAVGKRTTISEIPVLANAKLEIVIKKWEEPRVEEIRNAGLDWFCGAL